MLRYRDFLHGPGLLGPTHKIEKKRSGIWEPDTVSSKSDDGVWLVGKEWKIRNFIVDTPIQNF